VDNPDFTEQRDDLLRSIEMDRQEVRVALRELTGATAQNFDVGERIRTSPLTWTLGGFLVGMWLGSRSARAAAGPGRPR
jgi:hypothetical protein